MRIDINLGISLFRASIRVIFIDFYIPYASSRCDGGWFGFSIENVAAD